MSKVLLSSIAMLSFSLPVAVQAHECKYGNPHYDMHINSLQYSDEYYPYIKLSDGAEYSLLYSQGVDKVYGRAMLAVALTAMNINATVDVCINGSDVTSITIKQ